MDLLLATAEIASVVFQYLINLSYSRSCRTYRGSWLRVWILIIILSCDTDSTIIVVLAATLFSLSSRFRSWIMLMYINIFEVFITFRLDLLLYRKTANTSCLHCRQIYQTLSAIEHPQFSLLHMLVWIQKQLAAALMMDIISTVMFRNLRRCILSCFIICQGCLVMVIGEMLDGGVFVE